MNESPSALTGEAPSSDIAAPPPASKPTTTNVPAATAPKPTEGHLNGADDRVATLSSDDLREFASLPAPVQRLIEHSLQLTASHLVYRYGSDDPANGGMDCSGTVSYLLRGEGLADVPRDAGEIYRWVWEGSDFHAVVSSNPDTFELSRLKPGDLLFWTGTYQVDRDPPVTHVMIYLGTNRHTGRRVMVGASEGRRFNDVSRSGVSVFDFELPKAHAGGSTVLIGSGSRFIGYGAAPGLGRSDNKKGPL